MKKVIFLYNKSDFAYNFTKEIVEEYLKEGCQVTVIFPDDEYQEEFKKMGCQVINIPIDRRGTSFIKDYKLYKSYKKIFNTLKPDLIFGFTIKPNIYGAQAAKKYKIRFVARISGLGSAFQKKNMVYQITKKLYKRSFSKIEYIFFENQTNSEIFQEAIGKFENSAVIPGSGVNTEEFKYLEFPLEDEPTRFLFIGRVMHEKGVDEYLSAAKYLKEKHGTDIEFHIIGAYEENYKNTIDQYVHEGIIRYHGAVKNVPDYIRESHCIVLPSHHEGMSNALLEAQSSGRAVIGSKIPGVIETFEDNVSGFSFEVKNQEELNSKLELFYNLTHDDKILLGINGRKRVVEQFSRSIIIDKYIDFIKKNKDIKERNNL